MRKLWQGQVFRTLHPGGAIHVGKAAIVLASVALVASACSTLGIGLGGSSSAPTVSSISPNSGSTNGGNTVTISGNNFDGATQVSFGGSTTTNIKVLSNTSISVVVPSEPAIMNGNGGKVQVTVTNSAGTSPSCFTTIIFCGSAYAYVGPSAPPGCFQWSPGVITLHNLNASHTFPVYSKNGVTIGPSFDLNASTVNLAPSAQACVGLNGVSVNKFTVGGSLGESADFVVNITGPVSYSNTFPLLSQPLASFTIMAGPIPVEIVPALQLYATTSANVGVGATVSAANSNPLSESAIMGFNAGLQNGAWGASTTFKCATADNVACFAPGGVGVTAQAGVNVQANLWGQIDFLVYDLAGPDVQAGPMAQVGAVGWSSTGAAPWWAVCGGVQAGFGLAGNAHLFGGTQWIGKTYNLWGPSILAHSSGAPTSVSSACDPLV